MPTSDPPAQIKQDIILDTCLLQYIGDKNIAKNLIDYLSELEGANFNLAISNISVCELLSGTTQKQETDGLSILSLFKRYQVDDNVLVATSQLSTLYGREKIPNQDISIADKIIAATAILTGSLILTADVHDFPRPFFREAAEKLFYYSIKNKTRMRVVEVLAPNTVIINQRFSERPVA